MKIRTQWLLVLLSSLVLAACSGGDDSDGDGNGNGSSGGYSGSTSAATVDDSNKSDMATASSAGASRAIDSDSAPRASWAAGAPNEAVAILDQTIASIKDQQRSAGIQSRQTIDLSSSVCTAGGSAQYEIPDGAANSYGTFTIVYNKCKYGYGGQNTTVDGTSSWTNNEDGSYVYEYDLTVTYGSDSYVITGTYSCDSNYNCSYEDNFSQGGTSYKISNVEVSGNNTSGYDVSVRVYHEDYGYIDIEGEDLIACSSGGFSSGTITVTDSSSSAVLTVTYVSCSEMTVTYNGVSETLAQ